MMNRFWPESTRGGRRRWLTALVGSSFLALAACDGGDLPTGDEADPSVGVQFAVTANDGNPAQGELVVEGTNGSLTITELSFVVEEVELEGIRGTEDFERGPLFLDGLLDGSVVAVSSREIPPGRYDDLEFDIEAVDDDDLMAEMRAVYPVWPEDASVRLAGFFASVDGEIRDFVVYLDAEVEVELQLSPPLVVEDRDEEVLVVTLAPGLWFTRGDGTVLDLSYWDHIPGEELAELEVEIEDGFLKVEWDR